MPGRTIAIGDIHGCLAALAAILDAIRPQPDDTIVTLGDYVDRGPDVPGVLERLLALQTDCRLVPILGNHEELLLDILAGRRDFLDFWLSYGGDATLAAYGCQTPDEIPEAHVAFFKNCRPWYESDEHLFLHASYLSDQPLDRQPAVVLRWDSLHERQPGPHCSGKTAIVGHTSQKDGRILDLGYLKCIDTCCYGNGWLTALDVESGQLWQADKEGTMKDDL